MILHWIDIAFIIASVAAGTGIIYFFLMRRFDRALAVSQRDMERRLAALRQQMDMTEMGSDEAGATSHGLDPSEAKAAPVDPAPLIPPPQTDDLRATDRNQTAQPPSSTEDKDIPREIHVAITAAAIAAFGNHARVRSARRIPSSDVVSPWTQQGRVIVQSSHNLRARA